MCLSCDLLKNKIYIECIIVISDAHLFIHPFYNLIARKIYDHCLTSFITYSRKCHTKLLIHLFNKESLTGKIQNKTA